MSVNKNQENVIELTGKVVLKPFGKGSKSEHDAVSLETENGNYKLKREGGNPFNDSALNRLLGKTITAKGTLIDYLFIIKDYEEIN